MKEVGKVNGEDFSSSSDCSSDLLSDEDLFAAVHTTSSSEMFSDDPDDVPNIAINLVQHNSRRVHEPVVDYAGIPNHCHSFNDVAYFMYDNCDCTTEHNLPECCQTSVPPYEFFRLIDFGNEAVIDQVRSVDDIGNNVRRKNLYRRAFLSLDYGQLAEHERRALPKCIEAKIRHCHPSETGIYMGFLEA